MRLCPNCNEWYDEKVGDVCPNCAYKYTKEDRVSVFTANDIKSVIKERVTRRNNPWIIALVALINLAVILSIIDIFVSKVCWSVYPLILCIVGFAVARLVYCRHDGNAVMRKIRAYLMILSLTLIFYSIVIKYASKVGQDISFFIVYLLPLTYIAYIIATLVRFMLKGMGKANVIWTMASIIGVCLLLMILGITVFSAKGFALALCIIPVALSVLVAINLGLVSYIKLKKNIEKIMSQTIDNGGIDVETED